MKEAEFRIDRDGYWYWKGMKLTNERILPLFAANLYKGKRNEYFLEMKEETHPVIVDTVPFVIISIYQDRNSLILYLRDKRRLPWPKGKVSIENDVPFTTIKWNKDTLISRAAWWQLQKFLHETEDGYAIRFKNRTWPVHT